MTKRISWFLLLAAITLMWGCESQHAQTPIEFTARYVDVTGSNNYDRQLEIVEIRGHGHVCYVLRTPAYGSKTTLWCELESK